MVTGGSVAITSLYRQTFAFTELNSSLLWRCCGSPVLTDKYLRMPVVLPCIPNSSPARQAPVSLLTLSFFFLLEGRSPCFDYLAIYPVLNAGNIVWPRCFFFKTSVSCTYFQCHKWVWQTASATPKKIWQTEGLYGLGIWQLKSLG